MKNFGWAALACGVLLSSGASAQTMRIGLQEDPDALDPHRARTVVGRIVFTSLCDKLVDITPELKFTPQLATSWEWSGDNKTLTFKLRPGVKFHDGEPFNAAAVKANIERAKTLPDSLRKSEITSVDSVEAVDEQTVAFKLSKPDATLIAQLSDRAGMMLSPKAFAGDFAQKPVCSGPYKFVERVQNDRIVLEKFAEHWDAASYSFQRVVFLPIPDTTVRLANLRAGDLDMLERPAATDVKEIKADANLKFVSLAGLGYQGLTLNHNNGERSKNPFSQDKRIRQALSLAIDRNVLNEVVFEGSYPPANQPFPLASPYHDKAFAPPARDVAAAKKLLKEAGHERVKIEIQTANNNVQQQVAEVIQAMAAEAGFEISVRPTEFAAMQKEMRGGNFIATSIGWSGRVDPDGNIHQFVTCGGALNDMKYCNKEVDRLLDEARTVTDEAKRREIYSAAHKILNDELPIIYLYFEPRPFVTAKKVEGFRAYPDGLIRLKGVKFSG